MPQEKKSEYVERLRGEFIVRATAFGLEEPIVSDLADFFADKLTLSFRNGLNFAKRRGWMTSEPIEAVAA